METYLVRIIQSAVVLVIFFVAHLFIRRGVNSVLKKINFTAQRRKLTLRMLNGLLSIGAVVFISAIWGVNQSELVVFISSIMAILGVGFVAQWSLLSNITAGLILFFNHPLKIGDYMKIIEKDFIIEGTIRDITFFFVHIETKDKEKITISNTVLIQKTISIVSAADDDILKKKD